MQTPDDVVLLQLEEHWRQDSRLSFAVVKVAAPFDTAQNSRQTAQHIGASKTVAGRRPLDTRVYRFKLSRQAGIVWPAQLVRNVSQTL